MDFLYDLKQFLPYELIFEIKLRQGLFRYRNLIVCVHKNNNKNNIYFQIYNTP